MSDPVAPPLEPVTPPIDPVAPVAPIDPPAEIPQDVLDAAVDEKLKKMKANMDALDERLTTTAKERDEATAKVREAEIAALEAAGKMTEAAEAKLAQAKLEKEALVVQNLALTRNRDVHLALANITFRSGKAEQSATRDIVDSLVQDESGKWLSKTGQSLSDVVQAFVVDPENDYLMQPKVNSGGGQDPVVPDGLPPSDSIVGKSSTEVLDLAATGKLQRRGKTLHTR